jgi:hypothetical protein
MPLGEALSRGVQFFDNGHQFAAAGIDVETARPSEIAAAVIDMLEWLDQPDLPETPEQRAFRDQVASMADDLAHDGNPRLPIADFMGFSLPGYRIAPTVACREIGAVPQAAPSAGLAPPEPVLATRR